VNFLGRIWPAGTALVVLALGLQSWIRKYPRTDFASAAGDPAATAGDTALPAALRHSAAAADTQSAWDTAHAADPFYRGQPRRPSGGTRISRRPPAAPPSRNWKLKGMAGNSVATLIDSVGIKHLIRVGDSLGGARLLEVHSNRVLMQDAAGRFELHPEP
jgi:hypothetical protein